jgi:hypothetical protein
MQWMRRKRLKRLAIAPILSLQTRNLRCGQPRPMHAFYAYIRKIAMTATSRLHRRTRHAVLRPRESLLLDNARGTLLVVEHGCLWVTLEHDLRDIVLSRGMRFKIDRRGRTIVTAEADSAVRVVAPVGLRDRIRGAMQRAAASVRRDLAGRFAGRFAPLF